MAKVDLKHSKSEHKETVENVVTDSRGRLIKLRKPSVLAQFKLVSLVGGEQAKNEVYMQMVMPVIYVTEIDGVAVFPPQTQAELNKIIERLDEDGLQAVGEGLQEMLGIQATDLPTELKNG
jgi:hypothetical protein